VQFFTKKIIKGKNFTIFAVTRQEVLEQLREKREGKEGRGGVGGGKRGLYNKIFNI
jgi:hypothetical protein